jgi:hypothetical protein
MKFARHTLIAMVAAAAAFAVPAAAQQRMETHREVRTTTVVRHDNMGRADDKRHHGWTQRRVCSTRWVNHRKVRTCRMVRVRR